MSRCKWCRELHLMQRLDENGLCSKCAPVVSADLTERSNIVRESISSMEGLRKPEFELSCCDAILGHAEALLDYEKRGIRTLEPPPSELLRRYRQKRDELALKCFEREVEQTVSQFESIMDAEEKVDQLADVLTKVREAKSKAANRSHLNALDRKVVKLIHQIRLSAYCDDATVAEMEGHPEEALGLYYQALDFLKHHDVDESYREGSIWAIEEKIEELRSSVTGGSGPASSPPPAQHTQAG